MRFRPFPLPVLSLLLVSGALACQPPPPVGRAANPVARPSSAPAGSQSAELLAKIDGMKQELDSRPKDFKIQMALGKLYYENERFLDAASTFRAALDQQPDDVEALKLFGNCMFFLGNPDLAIKQHGRVLELAPKDIDALFFLGAILVESHPQDKDALKRAGDSWARFLEVAPTHPRAKEIAEQLEVVRKAERGELTLGTPEVAARNEQQVPEGGEQGAMGGRFEGGNEPAGGGAPPGPRTKKGTRVPALKENATPAERKRAETLDALDEGRFGDARKGAEELLVSMPDDWELAVARARALVQTGETENGIRAFGEVIKRNQRYSPAWHYLGMAHMMNGDAARAAQTWKDLMAMDPAYAREHRLDQRAAMAERMARSQQ